MPTTTYSPNPSVPHTSSFAIADLPYDVLGETGLPGLDGVVATDVPMAYQAHGAAGRCWVDGPRGQPLQECDNFLSYNNVAPDGTILRGALTGYDPDYVSPQVQQRSLERRAKVLAGRSGALAEAHPRRRHFRRLRIGPYNVLEWILVLAAVAAIVALFHYGSRQ